MMPQEDALRCWLRARMDPADSVKAERLLDDLLRRIKEEAS